MSTLKWQEHGPCVSTWEREWKKNMKKIQMHLCSLLCQQFCQLPRNGVFIFAAAAAAAAIIFSTVLYFFPFTSNAAAVWIEPVAMYICCKCANNLFNIDIFYVYFSPLSLSLFIPDAYDVCAFILTSSYTNRITLVLWA